MCVGFSYLEAARWGRAISQRFSSFVSFVIDIVMEEWVGIILAAEHKERKTQIIH